ncbi:MAG TPA: glycerol-3-phosphate 1-O-acyltransferase PlsY, partial [Pyrinomonadaceae bacterium]
MRIAIVLIVAYLIGSIPFGYLIVRLTGRGDVRETGSGGTGATNVSRRAGKLAGLVTLILDAVKGAFACLVAGVAMSPLRASINVRWVVAAAAVAVIAGHIFPLWLKFRGGKGVATAAGAFFMIAPFGLLCAGIVFLVVVAITRYVSLASLTAVVLIPFFMWLQKWLIQPKADIRPPLTAAVVAALLIIFAHRENIRRLVNGT